LLGRTVAAGGSIRALNAPDEITKKVGAQGLAGLTAAERETLPELDLTNAAHRIWFDRTVSGVGAHGGIAANNLYMAQVVRDETMAETAWQWLKAQPAGRQLAIAAGNGHCMDLAIPARMRRRGAAKVLIIHPVAEEPLELASVLGEAFSDVLVVFARQ
jgi:hypothetical protein